MSPRCKLRILILRCRRHYHPLPPSPSTAPGPILRRPLQHPQQLVPRRSPGHRRFRIFRPRHRHLHRPFPADVTNTQLTIDQNNVTFNLSPTNISCRRGADLTTAPITSVLILATTPSPRHQRHPRRQHHPRRLGRRQRRHAHHLHQRYPQLHQPRHRPLRHRPPQPRLRRRPQLHQRQPQQHRPSQPGIHRPRRRGHALDQQRPIHDRKRQSRSVYRG